MTTEELLKKVNHLAGDQRNKSFRMAVEMAIERKFTHFVETGCYRGIYQDGQSTLILGMVAQHAGGDLASYEIRVDHIKCAEALASDYEACIEFYEGDSVLRLSQRTARIEFLYLDSYDYDENNHLPSQMHQLAELGAAYGKLATNALILLDDCALPHGGKAGLSAPFLLERGWKLAYDGYQKLFTDEHCLHQLE